MPETISDAIGHDHHMFDVCADNIRNSEDDAAKVRWRNQLTWYVARHAISEELTMYPAMEKHMGEVGVQLTKTDKEQHQGVKNYLYELQDMTPTVKEFAPLLDKLMDALHHHIEHEKEEDMPRLEKLLSREESEALARSFQRTKLITPKRSHPSAPTSYYFETLAALFAAPMDAFQDLITGREFPTAMDEQVAAERAEEANAVKEHAQRASQAQKA